jgi:AraC-like DNA-binding protein
MKKKLIENIKALVKQEDYSDTYLDSVKVFYSTKALNKHKVIYKNCIIIVGQGYKNLYLKDKQYKYDDNNYLIVPATLPLECETSASLNKPFYAIIIEIDLNILSSLKKALDDLNNNVSNDIIYTSNLTDDILAASNRLLESLQSKQKADLFANGILKELYYYLLKGSNSNILYSLLDDNSALSRIHKSLNYIYLNLDKDISVDKLAEDAGMSVSTYYRYFKSLTKKAPLQLIKETKLTKAKELIEKQNYNANQAAFSVGYQSYSQFSREFKRMFNLSPKNYK